LAFNTCPLALISLEIKRNEIFDAVYCVDLVLMSAIMSERGWASQQFITLVCCVNTLVICESNIQVSLLNTGLLSISNLLVSLIVVLCYISWCLLSSMCKYTM